MKYRLPKGLKCTQCILQWIYTTGNNWGQCEDGTGALGCGPQEQFRGCSDIRITRASSLAVSNDIDFWYRYLYRYFRRKERQRKKNRLYS